jgi:IS5 family transposase
MTQHTFAIAGFDRYAKTTRREIFLEEMDRVIPWGELISLIEPHYPNAENGRPAIALEKMLRIHLLQHWFGLSDPAAEEAIYDSRSMRQLRRTCTTRKNWGSSYTVQSYAYMEIRRMQIKHR